MEYKNKKLGILVAGGPAPGINSVIGAATICANLLKTEVVGIQEGFYWLMQGDTSHVQPLCTEDVSRIHFQGGSALGISRTNPTRSKETLDNVVATLTKLDINRLITIGGDGTLHCISQVVDHAGGKIHAVHVPKTIDNDINLPFGQSTFGFQTARHVGVQTVKHLMNDAKTTRHWYFVVSMGRQAGHLALGIGQSSGASITVIPEEFGNDTISLREIVDTLLGTIIKRMSRGRSDGVAILAEGLLEKIDPAEIAECMDVPRDPDGRIRLSEMSLGELLRSQVQRELETFGLKMRVVAKNIGYELRCADPIPYDLSYTRNLGFLASHFVLHGGAACMITIEGMKFVPIPFASLVNPRTGQIPPRLVDTSSRIYNIAYTYMLRLKRNDFQDKQALAAIAKSAKMTPKAFRERFEYVTARSVHDVAF